jgi:hypothetical protein
MTVFCPKSWEPEMCICDVIAKVRADEREQAIRDCIAAVDGLSPWRKTDPDEVENALRGLRQP